MKLLFDTNVVLDLLLDRAPFAVVAERLVSRVERKEIEGVLGATTVTTLHYLLRKALGKPAAMEAIRSLLTLFAVAPVDGRILALAAELPFPDFEDAVLHEAARLAGAGGIVTRNAPDFAKAELPVYVPEEAEAILAVLDEDG